MTPSVRIYDPTRVRRAAAVSGGDTLTAVAGRAGSRAGRTHATRKEALVALLARLFVVIAYGVPWLCGVVLIGWFLWR